MTSPPPPSLRRPSLTLRLLGDRGGATAVEFGLLALPFIAILVCMLQVSILFFAGQALQTFTESTGRAILTGATQKAGYTQAAFKTSLCNAIYSLFKCSNLYVDVTTAGNFAGANTGLPQLTFDASGNVTNSWNYNLGTNGNIVVLRLMYQWPNVALPLGGGLGNQSDGSRLLMATAVFKNEQAN